MSSYSIEPIRRYGADQQLEAAGVRWVEIRSWVVWLYAVPGFFLLMAIILSGGAMLVSAFALKPTLIFLGSLVAFVLATRLLMFVGTRWRSLIFHRDGRIEMPEGLPTDSRFREFGFSSDRVSSIEKRFARTLDRNNTQFFVDLLSHDGDWVTIGDTLTEQLSHALTVQLTKALAEIREATARAHQSFTAEDAMRMAGDAINRMKRNGTNGFQID